MKIVCIADTHSLHEQIDSMPAGDCLVVAGDITDIGSLTDVRKFNTWLGGLPYEHKLVVAGNHDFCFQHYPRRASDLLTNAVYLQDSGIELEGVWFYGSPWQPDFCDWAFNLPRGEELAKKWRRIPKKTDVLITHSPPMGIGDYVMFTNEAVGCVDLFHRVIDIQPSLHVFGHIHGAHGVYEGDNTTFVNASICDDGYRPVHLPIVVEV